MKDSLLGFFILALVSTQALGSTIFPKDLERVFSAFQKESQQKDCSRSLKDKYTLLACLEKSGRGAFNESLIRAIYDKKTELYTKESQNENEIFDFYDYVEDLAFLNTKKDTIHFEEQNLQLEDGDVILAFGGLGISGLATFNLQQTTNFSHAGIVRKTDKGVTTIESQAQTGVYEFPINDFYKEGFTHYAVLRWKNKAERKKISKLASEQAYAWSVQKVQYDGAMDIHTPESFYCTELVARSYAKAANVPLEKLFNLNLMSRAVNKDIYEDFQMPSKDVFSNRTLLSSGKFAIVSVYKNPKKIVETMALKALVRNLNQLYGQGYRMEKPLVYTLASKILNPYTAKISPLFNKSYALTQIFGEDGFVHIAHLEKNIVADIFKKIHDLNLTKNSPVEIERQVTNL